MSLHQAYRGGYNGRPGWWLHFDYDETLLEYIKAYDASKRAWDAEAKRWWISEDLAEQVAVWLPGFEAHLRQKALL